MYEGVRSVGSVFRIFWELEGESIDGGGSWFAPGMGGRGILQPAEVAFHPSRRWFGELVTH